jgi:hypothetical protein
MKLNLNNSLILLLFFGGLLTWALFATKGCVSNKERAKTQKNNYIALQDVHFNEIVSHKKTIDQFDYEAKNLKKALKQKDSILSIAENIIKSMNINPKNVKTVTKIEYIVRDTGLVVLRDTVFVDTVNSMIGTINDGYLRAVVTLSGKKLKYDYQYTDEIDIVLNRYKERKFIGKLFEPWKYKTDTQMGNKRSDISTAIQINFTK